MSQPATVTDFTFDNATLQDGLSWLTLTQATDSLSLPSANATLPYTKSDHIVGTTGTYGDIDPSTFFDAFTVTSSQDIDSRFMTTSSTITPLGRLDSFDFQEQSITHTGWSPNLPDLATTRRL
jgi:hypothetical protein